MKNSAPIIIIEDDADDREFLSQIFINLNVRNKLLFFTNGVDAYEHLVTMKETPFLIICDINMPLLSGLQLREQITADENLKSKAIPFVFLTTSAATREIENAYGEAVQGYFIKPHTLDELQHMLEVILNYWRLSLKPEL